MANYATDIPALPGLASGAHENVAANIAAGTPLNDNNMHAAQRQYKNRKRLANCDPPAATQDEVTAAKRRKREVESAHFDGPTPHWAQQMQQQMQQMQQQLQRQMKEESARSMNRARRNTADPITSLIRLSDGALPNDAPHNLQFPANQQALESMTGARLTHLLNFYGLAQDGTVTEKKDRLKQHLQVTL